MNKASLLAASIIMLLSHNSLLFAQEDKMAEHSMAPVMQLKLEHCPKGEVDLKLQALLAQVANIFLNFVGVVQNPDNAGEHITNMVSGAVQMIAQAVKSGELSIDATEQEIVAYATRMSRAMTLQDVEQIKI